MVGSWRKMRHSGLRIAYDGQIFTNQNYGGVSRYFVEIAGRLSREPDVHVRVVAPMHINAYLPLLPDGVVKGFRAPDTSGLARRFSKDYAHIVLRRLGIYIGGAMLRASSPDVVHETYFFPKLLGPRRARRVLTIHDMIHEKFSWSFPTGDKTAGFKAAAASRADHIICVSESTRRDAIEILRLPPEKTTVIYHGFGLMASLRETAELGRPDFERPYILYVGERSGRKNFRRLVEAYSSSRHLRSEFNLVCFGGGAFRSDELSLLDRLGLDHGRVLQLSAGDDILAALYKGAVAFVYPSLYEGFGIPPLEAMAFDCPVVCSRTSSIPEVVGDAGEYIEPEEIESIREAIEHVVYSPERQKELSARGRQRLKLFSWDICAQKTLTVYRRLLEN